jgi:aminoglycoside 3-N-acetyltransferase
MGEKKTERDVIKNTTHPNTITTLIQDFEELGLKPGLVVIMHSSLSKMGWTVGGSVSVIRALLHILTPEGTLVMFTSTGDNTEPSNWENPPVPEDWWPIIRREMPAYNPGITPTRGLGVIVEAFRKWPGVIRSDHPTMSFAAWGKHAAVITKDHYFPGDLGEESPLARIYDLEGQVLMIGVNHSNNTSLHLAEYRSEFPGKQSITNGTAIRLNKKKKWVVWEGLDINSDDFERLGIDFESSYNYSPGIVGLAEARLISQRTIVDFAVDWFRKNRKIK